MMTEEEIKKLAKETYEEFIFCGTGKPTYGVDFDNRHILQALEMMVHKTNEHWLKENISNIEGINKKLEVIKNNLTKTEGL